MQAAAGAPATRLVSCVSYTDAPAQEEGFRLRYFRVPVTRSRSSVREKANDLDRLLTVLENSLSIGTETAFAIVSHTGTGMAGYVMALCCCFLMPSHSGPTRRASRTHQMLVGSPETRHLMEDDTRDIASLIRVLKFGTQAKETVDRALEACGPSCQQLDEDLRAFLILAASFILGRRAAVREGRSDTRFGNGAFNAFFRDRAELGFLLSHIKAARA